MLPTVNIAGVEIFAEGQRGPDYYSRADLDGMVEAFGKVGFEPTVKLNDSEERTFGAPAVGYVSRLYRNGSKLIADMKQVPRRLAAAIKGNAHAFGCEVLWSYRDEAKGKTWPRVLRSVIVRGDNLPRLDSLDAITNLFAHSSNARAYQRTQTVKVYQNSTEDNSVRNQNISINRSSLTGASNLLHQEIMRYAADHGVEYRTAAKSVLREYQSDGSSGSSAESELATIGKGIRSALGLSFVDSILQAAKTRPDLVRELADNWLMAKAKERARGGAGFVSDNERLALRGVTHEFPEVTAARTGTLDERALRTLFPQWFR